jgi:Spy/CpxP family protein refolding chaperone
MTRTLALVGLTALTLVGSATIQAQPPRQAGQDQRSGIARHQMGQMGQMGQRGQLPQRGPQWRRGPGGGPGLALRGLALTDDQKAQVKAIHEKTRAEIQAVLTPEQLATLKARRGGRGGGR